MRDHPPPGAVGRTGQLAARPTNPAPRSRLLEGELGRVVVAVDVRLGVADCGDQAAGPALAELDDLAVDLELHSVTSDVARIMADSRMNSHTVDPTDFAAFRTSACSSGDSLAGT